MRKFRFAFFFLPFVLVPLVALAMMGLWNWLMPAVFGLTAINFLQALGLFVLAKILFGSFGGRRFGRFSRHRMMFAPAGMGCGSYDMSREQRKEKMRERWQNLTPEQKEEFAKRRERCVGKEHSPEKTEEPKN